MNTTFLLSATEQGVAWGDFIFYIVTFLILLALVKKFAMILILLNKRVKKQKS